MHALFLFSREFFFFENPSLSRLVPSIVATIEECHDLGQRCFDVSYSGKLLIRGGFKGFDSYKGVLAGAGVIAPLIKVFDWGSELGKVAAARCLMKFTENSDNAWAVSAHGGVTALLNICGDSDSKENLVGPACSVKSKEEAIQENEHPI